MDQGLKQNSQKKEEKPKGRNKKNEVYLFLTIYLGFLFLFLAYFNSKVFENFISPANSISDLFKVRLFCCS